MAYLEFSLKVAPTFFRVARTQQNMAIFSAILVVLRAYRLHVSGKIISQTRFRSCWITGSDFSIEIELMPLESLALGNQLLPSRLIVLFFSVQQGD